MSSTSPVLPESFAIADKLSLRGQRRSLRGTAARLLLTLVAALALALAPLWSSDLFHRHHVEVLGLGAAALFLAAMLVELWLLRRQPEQEWYDGRAVAESIKTLTWRYAVGGLPYPIDEEASGAIDRDLRGLTTDVAQLHEAVASARTSTSWMDDLRSTNLESRRRAYLNDRIVDQENWYSNKAAHNLRRAKWWSFSLISAEALAIVLAALKSLAIVSIDLASFGSAVIGCGAAWLAVKQHTSIGTAYLLASRELAAVKQRLLSVKDEIQWTVEVADAEDAISREHTMWRASRTIPDPATGHGRHAPQE